MTLRVLHLAGSPVSDFYADLSRLYAADALVATADPERYEFVAAYVAPGGRWCFPSDLTPEAIAAAPSMEVGEALAHLASLDIDVAVPQLFCIPGMTSYRALLDVLAIPYVGNTPDAMALGAHKARARSVVSAAGVSVPAGEVLRIGERPSIAPPAVVKPVDADNSLGIGLVRERDEYDDALAAAFAHSDEVLVESYVELGREVRVGLVERSGELVGLPLEEYSVHPDTKPIRDHADKIGAGVEGGLKLMAKDAEHAWIVDAADPLTERVQEAARRCHRAMGARHYSLFDFRIDEHGEPWFLEAGLYCSFARTSVVAVMAAAAGITLPDLFATALAEALPGTD
ncbi:hypothetical protein [Allobranchiibius sp. GilTou73]|uniref:D-alanine--D-alanine ligase family protein n=1 Tax=Allobranchiibius sp. GilTou73 TaxID=2904523 RepID=UPI001F491B5F|nr:hypothetical protein [Allobranchiibius sp. GilTou73]UIJ36138.1 hypothetical protein LVQ62_07160 [Allobranchiibius sp. GilTou73]